MRVPREFFYLVAIFVILGSVFLFNMWRANEFSKATGMSFWKAYWVMGK